MAGKTIRRTLAITLSLIACLGASAQETPVQQSVQVQGVKDPSAWKRADSAHFIVYSDAKSAEVMGLVNRLERLDYLMRIYLRDYMRAPAAAQKLTLYYHDRIEGFKDAAISPPANAIGLYNSCPTAVQGFAVHLDPIDEIKNEQLATHRLDEGMSYVFEAYARHFLYRNTVIRSPSSFIEGMAQYFSGLRFSDDQLVLGRTPANIGRYLAVVDNGNPYGLEYRDVLKHDDKQGAGYAELGRVRASAATLDYQAKSWLLMHFMLSSAERRTQMDAYLKLAYADTPAVSAFEQAFGMKVDDLGTAMWRYRRQGAQVLRSDFPIPADIPIAISTLNRAAGDVVLANAQLKSCPDRKTGEALLSALGRQSGAAVNNEFVLLTLSRAQIDWGNPEQAIAPLTALLRAKPRHAEALQLLGMAELRLAARQQGPASAARFDAARRHLAQAQKLDPGSSEAAHAVFKAELGAQAVPSKLALASAIAAWKNAPEVSSLARSAALAYAYAGKADETETVLALLTLNSEDAASAAWARQWRSRLAGGVSRDELVAEMRLDAAAPSFREWTIAASDLLRTVECHINVENARGAIESRQDLSLADKMTFVSNLRFSCVQ
jgi:tetratricopeptide (TPR) repeat protein